jgi:cardiolipin synthase
METKEKTFLLTLPNILSFLRILLVPVFLAAMLQKRAFEAFAIFTLAGLTDLLDGFTARIWRQKTKIGVFLDPAADKFLLTTSFILCSLPSLGFPNTIPLWLTIVVVARDLILAIGSFIIYRLRNQKIFYPSLLGKASTVCQVGTVLLVLFFNSLRVSPSALSWVYYLTLAATFLSSIHYFAMGFALIFHPQKT